MEVAAKPFTSTKRASVSEAKLAYFEGDFERCLAICAEIRVRTISTASEVALLSARAYLRTGRPREAEQTIVETADTHATLDASVTAEMLLGSARIRQGDADGGIALLEAVAARSADAHAAIRSEIAFATAFGFWMKRDIDTAESYLARVDRRADIIHARALELGAWCQMARGNYRRCAEFFILTLLRLDSCHAQDRAITGTAISTLAILAAELFDREIARVVEHRANTMEWTSGLVVQHYLTLLHQAMFAEMAGDTLEAFQLTHEARDIAPTVPFEAVAWSVSSIIARNAGETCSAAFYAQRAGRVLSSVELSDLEGEERFSMLTVAESCATFDLQSANRLFAEYWGLAPADKLLALTGDPRLVAEETLISGVVADARGEAVKAEQCFRRAFEDFSHLGYTRRAIVAAFALYKLTGDAAAKTYIGEHLAGTSNYITRYLADHCDDRLALVQRHPIVAALPKAQREVVALLCRGKTNREIAALRNVGEQTIKNMLTKQIFPAFGVSSRAALVSLCLRAASS